MYILCDAVLCSCWTSYPLAFITVGLDYCSVLSAGDSRQSKIFHRDTKTFPQTSPGIGIYDPFPDVTVVIKSSDGLATLLTFSNVSPFHIIVTTCYFLLSTRKGWRPRTQWDLKTVFSPQFLSLTERLRSRSRAVVWVDCEATTQGYGLIVMQHFHMSQVLVVVAVIVFVFYRCTTCIK